MDSVQCILEKPINNGAVRQISWIPARYAVLNRYLELKEGNVWENGWKVVALGGRQTREERIERSGDHMRQRKGSDI